MKKQSKRKDFVVHRSSQAQKAYQNSLLADGLRQKLDNKFAGKLNEQELEPMRRGIMAGANQLEETLTMIEGINPVDQKQLSAMNSRSPVYPNDKVLKVTNSFDMQDRTRGDLRVKNKSTMKHSPITATAMRMGATSSHLKKPFNFVRANMSQASNSNRLSLQNQIKIDEMCQNPMQRISQHQPVPEWLNESLPVEERNTQLTMDPDGRSFSNADSMRMRRTRGSRARGLKKDLTLRQGGGAGTKGRNSVLQKETSQIDTEYIIQGRNSTYLNQNQNSEQIYRGPHKDSNAVIIRDIDINQNGQLLHYYPNQQVGTDVQKSQRDESSKSGEKSALVPNLRLDQALTKSAENSKVEMMLASGGQRPPLNIHSDMNSFTKEEGVQTKSVTGSNFGGTAKNSAKKASRRDESKGSLAHKKSSVEKSVHDSHRSGKYIKIGAVLCNVNIIHQAKSNASDKKSVQGGDQQNNFQQTGSFNAEQIAAQNQRMMNNNTAAAGFQGQIYEKKLAALPNYYFQSQDSRRAAEDVYRPKKSRSKGFAKKKGVFPATTVNTSKNQSVVKPYYSPKAKRCANTSDRPSPLSVRPDLAGNIGPKMMGHINSLVNPYNFHLFNRNEGPMNSRNVEPGQLSRSRSTSRKSQTHLQGKPSNIPTSYGSSQNNKIRAINLLYATNNIAGSQVPTTIGSVTSQQKHNKFLQDFKAQNSLMGQPLPNQLRTHETNNGSVAEVLNNLELGFQQIENQHVQNTESINASQDQASNHHQKITIVQQDELQESLAESKNSKEGDLARVTAYERKSMSVDPVSQSIAAKAAQMNVSQIQPAALSFERHNGRDLQGPFTNDPSSFDQRNNSYNVRDSHYGPLNPNMSSDLVEMGGVRAMPASHVPHQQVYDQMRINYQTNAQNYPTNIWDQKDGRLPMQAYGLKSQNTAKRKLQYRLAMASTSNYTQNTHNTRTQTRGDTSSQQQTQLSQGPTALPVIANPMSRGSQVQASPHQMPGNQGRMMFSQSMYREGGDYAMRNSKLSRKKKKARENPISQIDQLGYQTQQNFDRNAPTLQSMNQDEGYQTQHMWGSVEDHPMSGSKKMHNLIINKASDSPRKRPRTKQLSSSYQNGAWKYQAQKFASHSREGRKMEFRDHQSVEEERGPKQKKKKQKVIHEQQQEGHDTERLQPTQSFQNVLQPDKSPTGRNVHSKLSKHGSKSKKSSRRKLAQQFSSKRSQLRPMESTYSSHKLQGQTLPLLRADGSQSQATQENMMLSKGSQERVAPSEEQLVEKLPAVSPQREASQELPGSAAYTDNQAPAAESIGTVHVSQLPGAESVGTELPPKARPETLPDGEAKAQTQGNWRKDEMKKKPKDARESMRSSRDPSQLSRKAPVRSSLDKSKKTSSVISKIRGKDVISNTQRIPAQTESNPRSQLRSVQRSDQRATPLERQTFETGGGSCDGEEGSAPVEVKSQLVQGEVLVQPSSPYEDIININLPSSQRHGKNLTKSNKKISTTGGALKEAADISNQRTMLQTGYSRRKKNQGALDPNASDGHHQEGDLPQFIEGYGVRQRDLLSKQSQKLQSYTGAFTSQSNDNISRIERLIQGNIHNRQEKVKQQKQQLGSIYRGSKDFSVASSQAPKRSANYQSRQADRLSKAKDQKDPTKTPAQPRGRELTRESRDKKIAEKRPEKKPEVVKQILMNKQSPKVAAGNAEGPGEPKPSVLINKSKSRERSNIRKQVKFDGPALEQDGRKTDRETQQEIMREYEGKYGKIQKFIQNNSPIDRYYKLYVVEPKTRVYGEADGLDLDEDVAAVTPEKLTPNFKHLKTCPLRCSRSSISPSKSPMKKPSPLKQMQIMNQVQQLSSIEEVVQIADNDETRSVLQMMHNEHCDCHLKQKEIMRGRLTKSPSLTKSNAAGSQSVYAGDGASFNGNFEPEDAYFRKFRTPCRKTCSTTHNPMFHTHRFTLQKQAANKRRPKSAEKTKEQKKQELYKMDWFMTHINEAIRDQQNKEASLERDTSPNLDLRKQQSKVSEATRKSMYGQRESEIEDMKNLLKQLDAPEQPGGVLSDREISHYYTVMKDPALKGQLSGHDKKVLTRRLWKTLKVYMSSMMLIKDFNIIFESSKNKQQTTEKNAAAGRLKPEQVEAMEDESIIKLLLRCEKMYDAKQEIVRILLKLKKREGLMSQFEDEVDDCSEIRAKGYYYIILKLSCRIFNQIERVRVDNPLLNRPFIYNRSNMQNTLVKDILNIRTNLAKKFKGIKKELDRVLDKNGKIVKIQHIISLNKRAGLDQSDNVFVSDQMMTQSLNGDFGGGSLESAALNTLRGDTMSQH